VNHLWTFLTAETEGMLDNWKFSYCVVDIPWKANVSIFFSIELSYGIVALQKVGPTIAGDLCSDFRLSKSFTNSRFSLSFMSISASIKFYV
jgi:hypothetical protein